MDSLPLGQGQGVGQGHLKREVTCIITEVATKAPLQITLKSSLRVFIFHQSQQAYFITQSYTVSAVIDNFGQLREILSAFLMHIIPEKEYVPNIRYTLEGS